MVFTGYELDHYEPLVSKLRNKIFCGYIFSDNQRVYMVKNGAEINYKGDLTAEGLLEFVNKQKGEL